MTDDTPEPLGDIVRDNIIVRLNESSYPHFKRIDWGSFIPQIPSFGFVLLSIGMLMIFVIGGIHLGIEAVGDGLGWSDFNNATTALLIGSLVVYYFIRELTRQIERLTDPEDIYDGNSIAELAVILVLGIVFLSLGVLFRIHFVPGLNAGLVYTGLTADTLSMLWVISHMLALDLIYFGLLLMGGGIMLQSSYNIAIQLGEGSRT